MYTYLGVSHLNAHGSPQTPKCPFHRSWSNAYYMVIWCQGSITNILKERAKFCTAFPQKRPIHRNNDRAVYLTQLKFGSQSRNQKKKSQNNKRMIIIAIYHFGFWMHWLDLGRSTGVAEIWTLHSQEAGVHWHLSLHLRERKATESEVYEKQSRSQTKLHFSFKWVI